MTVELPTLFVVNCYAPRAESLERHRFRRKWDEALQTFVKSLLDKGKQVVLCGDFNVLREKVDIYPENEREHYAMQGMKTDERLNLEKLLQIGFIDAFRYKHPHVTDSYTFWSNRKHKREENKGWRLDYFFVSKRVQDSINAVEHLNDIMGSDHSPILLDIDVWFTDTELAEEWNKTNWIKAEKKLEYYQRELTKATFAGNEKKISEIQKLIVNHSLIKRLAVRQVSEKTNTPGIDNVRWHTAAEKING